MAEVEGSVGILLRSHGSSLIVAALTPAGPAADAGEVRVDDEITAVENVPVHGEPHSETIARLRGTVGSQVSVALRRHDAAKNDPVEKEVKARGLALEAAHESAGSQTPAGTDPPPETLLATPGGRLVLAPDAELGTEQPADDWRGVFVGRGAGVASRHVFE